MPDPHLATDWVDVDISALRFDEGDVINVAGVSELVEVVSEIEEILDGES